MATFISLCIIALAIGLTQWWFPRLHPGHYGTRSAKAWMALWVFLWLAARTSAASFAVLLVWQAFGLLTFRVEQIAEGLVAGIAAAAFGHGVARGMFAPERPERRLVEEDDATAQCFHNHLMWSSRTLGVLIVRESTTRRDGFPEDLRARLEHLIVSHHGSRQLGSPVEPMTIEALILSAADDLDAKIDQVRRHVADDEGEGEFTAFHPRLRRAFLKPGVR